jgi:NADH-quinone oxidoreductase subunit C
MSAPTEPSTAPASTGMSPADLGAYLAERFGDLVTDVEVAYEQVTVTVEADTLVDAARACKSDDRLGFDFWEFNTGVDLTEEGFALVVGLYSTVHRHRIHLRTLVPGGRDEPVVPSLTGVYRGANWSERETYDMFGITFEGHPQLLPRILTVENFEGYPLRKEFLLMTRQAKPWPGDKEPAEKSEDSGEASSTTSGDTPVPAEDKAAAAKAKAERAKAKAAEARKRKARERAAAEQGAEGGDRTERAEAEGTPQQPDAASVPEAEGAGGPDADPEAEGERSAAASAAGADVPEGTPDATTPEGAAEIAGSDIAEDAAAGAVGGDVAAGAPGDSPESDQPVEDLEHEAEMGEGAAPTASGSPGVEAEGRHAGADEQSGSKPAAETPGMKADPADPDEPQTEITTLAEETGVDEPDDTGDEEERP